MIINFTKMHSLGNDFVIIEAITQNIKLHGAYIKKIATLKTGIGCDQVIILEPPMNPTSDFFYKIYNSDGKTAEQCLNGIRCAARFALDSGLVKKPDMIAECLAGKINLTVENNHNIVSSLIINNPEIHNFKINILGINLNLYSLSIGNHHFICFINDQENIKQNLPELNDPYYGSAAEIINQQQNIFTHGANIGFAKILNPNQISLRVFERGSGETLACGSNALATFIVAKQFNLTQDPSEIVFKLGSLKIQSNNNNFIVTGPANTVFNGKFKIDTAYSHGGYWKN